MNTFQFFIFKILHTGKMFSFKRIKIIFIKFKILNLRFKNK